MSDATTPPVVDPPADPAPATPPVTDPPAPPATDDNDGLMARVTELLEARLGKLGVTGHDAPDAGALETMVKRLISDTQNETAREDRLKTIETRLESLTTRPRRGWGAWLVGI